MINATQFVSHANSIVSRIFAGSTTDTTDTASTTPKTRKKDCIEESIDRIAEAFLSFKDCVAALFGCEKSTREKTPMDVLVEKGKSIVQSHINGNVMRSMHERNIKTATIISLDNQIIGSHCGKIDGAYRSSISSFAKKAGEELQRSLIGQNIGPYAKLNVVTIYLEDGKSTAANPSVTLHYRVTDLRNQDTNEDHSISGIREAISPTAAQSAIEYLMREITVDSKNCKQELSRFFFDKR
ncbi:MAG: hypothetical protein V4492_09520 [Chlamydiota bacterium]